MKKEIVKFFKKNTPIILSVASGVGLVLTTASAIKSSPKALRLLDEATKEKGQPLTKLETLNVAGPSYIPTALLCVGTLGCIAGAGVINYKKQASLISAYSMLNSSYERYKELAGEATDLEIQKKMAAEAAIARDELPVVGISDAVLFFDDNSGRYFSRSVEEVLAAEYELNKKFIQNGFASLNDFYKFLLIEGITYGDDIGWSVHEGLYCWVDFVHEWVSIDDDMECYILTTPYRPDANYLDA